jgi:hypothetical protein
MGGHAKAAQFMRLCWRLLALAGLGFATGGCTPKVGDACETNLDCSTLGDRLCDTTQPGGYCTVFNCEAGACPDEAACVAFNMQLDPACQSLDDSRSGRFGTTFCMFVCEEASDCRDGYECAAPASRYALQIDTTDDKSALRNDRICLPLFSTPDLPMDPPGICSPGTKQPLVPHKPQPSGGQGGAASGSGGQGGAASGSGGQGGAASGSGGQGGS